MDWDQHPFCLSHPDLGNGPGALSSSCLWQRSVPMCWQPGYFEITSEAFMASPSKGRTAIAIHQSGWFLVSRRDPPGRFAAAAMGTRTKRVGVARRIPHSSAAAMRCVRNRVQWQRAILSLLFPFQRPARCSVAGAEAERRGIITAPTNFLVDR